MASSPAPASWRRCAGELVISAFEFSTPHSIVFKDWRLTLLQVFFTGCVAVYVVIRALLFWSIVNYDQVATGFNSWCFVSWISPSDSDLTSPHCGQNPTFDLAPVDAIDLGGISAYNFTCPQVTGDAAMKQVGEEAQVTVSQLFRRNTPGCEHGVSTDAVDANGKPCFENYFFDGVEDLPLFLIHTVSASQTGIRRNLMECEIVGSQGGPVLGRMTTGANNNGWPFTLRELLRYAGNYSLDDLNEGNIVPIRPGTKIRLRHTGFILTLRFRYWNYQAWPEAYWDKESFPWDWRPSEPRCALEVELQPQAWGFVGAVPVSEGLMLTNVARIQFVGSGQFGQISSVLLISSLVEAVVLLGIASSVTLYVARCLYGDAFREVTETSFRIHGTYKKEDGEEAANGNSSAGPSRLFSRKTFAPVDRTGQRTGLPDFVSSASLTSQGPASASMVAQPTAGSIPGLSAATTRLLQDLAISERLRQEPTPTDEALLQVYLRQRLAGQSDEAAKKSLCLHLQLSQSEQVDIRLAQLAERCASQVGAADDNLALDELLNLSTRWRGTFTTAVPREESETSGVHQLWV